MSFGPDNATCPEEWLSNWVFRSPADVPLDFKSPVAGKILRCGSDTSPVPPDKSASGTTTSQTLTSFAADPNGSKETISMMQGWDKRQESGLISV